MGPEIRGDHAICGGSQGKPAMGPNIAVTVPTCRVLNPWISAFVKHIQGYHTQSLLVRAREKWTRDNRSVVVILPNPLAKKRDSTADRTHNVRPWLAAMSLTA